jgi:hypothetical protein
MVDWSAHRSDLGKTFGHCARSIFSHLNLPPRRSLTIRCSFRYGSSPSLFDSSRLTASPTSAYFSSHSNGSERHQQQSVRAQPPVSSSMTSQIGTVALGCDQSADVSALAGGKPTVQVHPMPFSQPPPCAPPRSCKDDLKVATGGDGAHNNNSRGNPSPRPPVPRKPERLLLSPPRRLEPKMEDQPATDGREGISTSVQQLSSFFGRMAATSSPTPSPSPAPRPSVNQRQHEKDRWSSSVR